MAYFNDGEISYPISYSMFEHDLDTAGTAAAIRVLLNYIEEYYSKKDTKMDKIILKLKFGIITKSEEINPDTKPLQIVEVVLTDYNCMNGEKRKTLSPERDDIRDTHYFNGSKDGEFIAHFDFLLTELENDGYEIKGISSLEDIKNKIINGEPAYGEITKTLNKTKEKQKIKIKKIK